MPIAFSRTLRVLKGDDFHASGFIMLGIVVLFLAWGGWFFFAKMTVYEMTENARLEVRQASVPIEMRVNGQVDASFFKLDDHVIKDQILLQLDSTNLKLALEKNRESYRFLQLENKTLENQIHAERSSLKASQKAAGLVIEEEQSQYKASEAGRKLSKKETEMMDQLHKEGYISDFDLMRLQSETSQQNNFSEAQRLKVLRKEQEKKALEQKAFATLVSLKKEKEQTEGEIAQTAFLIKQLEYDIEKRTVRAQATGRIAEAVNLPKGTVLAEGQRVGSILPDGKLKVVAYFTPDAAIGRIRPGQTGRLRLYGFPWTQYGFVRCSVTHVASEIRNNKIQVWATIRNNCKNEIPLQHGLPGSFEIELKRLSPMALVLEQIGMLMDRRNGITENERNR